MAQTTDATDANPNTTITIISTADYLDLQRKACALDWLEKHAYRANLYISINPDARWWEVYSDKDISNTGRTLREACEFNYKK